MFLTKKSKILFSCLLIVLSFLITARLGLAATGAQKATDGLDATASQGYGLSWNQLTSPANSDLPTIIGRVIGAGLAFLGVIFFALILYAGLGWILSMGKEEKINEAKEMIIAAVLGLLVVLGAYAITNLLAQIFSKTL